MLYDWIVDREALSQDFSIENHETIQLGFSPIPILSGSLPFLLAKVLIDTSRSPMISKYARTPLSYKAAILKCFSKSFQDDFVYICCILKEVYQILQLASKPFGSPIVTSLQCT